MLIQVVHLRSEIVLRCLIESPYCRPRLVFKPSYRGSQFTPCVSPKPRPDIIILLSGRPNPFRRIDTWSRSQDRAARLSNKCNSYLWWTIAAAWAHNQVRHFNAHISLHVFHYPHFHFSFSTVTTLVSQPARPLLCGCSCCPEYLLPYNIVRHFV